MSQPPHLVFGYFYYCLQNLSSDHLLSGVSADYYETGFRVNRGTAADNRGCVAPDAFVRGSAQSGQ